MDVISNLEMLLAKGQDTALLRFSLGSAYFKKRQFGVAGEHLSAAVSRDPDYSAAWKLYGRALAETGRLEEALEAFDQGIAVAERKGDIQAAKEMRVFRKRVVRSLGGG